MYIFSTLAITRSSIKQKAEISATVIDLLALYLIDLMIIVWTKAIAGVPVEISYASKYGLQTT